MSKIFYRSIETRWLGRLNNGELETIRIPFTNKYKWTQEEDPKDKVRFVYSVRRIDWRLIKERIRGNKYRRNLYSWYIRLRHPKIYGTLRRSR